MPSISAGYACVGEDLSITISTGSVGVSKSYGIIKSCSEYFIASVMQLHCRISFETCLWTFLFEVNCQTDVMTLVVGGFGSLLRQ